MGTDRSNVSVELLEAQAALLKRRKQLAASRAAATRPSGQPSTDGRLQPSSPPKPQPDDPPWTPDSAGEERRDGRERPSAAAAPAPQNDVTTSNYHLQNAAALVQQYRRRDRVEPRGRLQIGRDLVDLSHLVPAHVKLSPDGDQAATPAAEDGETAVQPTPPPDWVGEGVLHYPTLGMAFLPKKGQGNYTSSCYQVWLWAVWYEQKTQSHGCLEVSEFRGLLADRLGWSSGQIRKVLGRGDGRFWTRDDRGRLFRHGPHRIANEFETGRLKGQPVILPFEAMEADRGLFNAHLFVSFFSAGSDGERRVAQKTIQTIYGIDERTQRRYLSRLSVKRDPHSCVVAYGGRDLYAELVKEHDYKNLFWVWDGDGREGKRGDGVWMKRNPNTTHGAHRQKTAGRKKKLNRRIDSVEVAPRGNGMMERVFHPNAKAAVRAWQKNPDVDHIYPAYRTKSGMVVDRVIPARSKSAAIHGHIRNNPGGRGQQPVGSLVAT